MQPAQVHEYHEFALLWLIPVLPLIGAAINGLAGAKLMKAFGPKVNHIIAIIMPSISFIITVIAFIKLIGLDEHHRALRFVAFPFIHIGFMDADFSFMFDPLSATVTLIITFIGTLIHIYSVGYMHGDKSYWRFFTYLNLFMASMLMLVLGDNFLIMFIGWEGVGLCSYLLISFWYKEKANATAGMKAFVVNRVGDFGFVIGVALLFWGLAAADGPAFSGEVGSDAYKQGRYAQREVSLLEKTELARQASEVGFKEPTLVPPASLRFDLVKARIEADKARWTDDSPSAIRFLGIPLVALICIFLFIGATGKSAQIPLYVWLPDAMAGPTPVSALIHAATMVTAGVYMVARLNFLFSLSTIGMTVVAVVGALTALFAATIGLFQYDIKKVLAYSTVSQLGYMFIGVGTGAYWAGVFHLLTHAVFKACLFLGSGSVILGCHHEQDMRKMGGLKKYMPITHWTYWLACVAITTAPFFFLSNGFFSKDEILWKAFDAQHLLVPGWSIWLLGFIGAGCTSFYMWRNYYMTFTGEYRGGHEAHGHDDDHAHDDAHADDDHGHHGGEPHESPKSMTYVLATLAALIILTIPLGFWPLLHIEPLFEKWLHPVVGAATESLSWLSKEQDVYALEITMAAASVVLAMSMWLFARWMYKDAKNPLPQKLLDSPSSLLRVPHRVIFNKYFVDELYDWAIVRRSVQLGRAFFKFDQKVIDGLVHSAAAIGRMIGTIDGLIDSLIVDGAVNGVAQATAAAGRAVRSTQTGRLQTYLLGAIGGAFALVLVTFLLF